MARTIATYILLIVGIVGIALATLYQLGFLPAPNANSLLSASIAALCLTVSRQSCRIWNRVRTGTQHQPWFAKVYLIVFIASIATLIAAGINVIDPGLRWFAFTNSTFVRVASIAFIFLAWAAELEAHN